MYVGLDVHKKVCYGTIMSERGEIVKEGKFSNDPRCLEEFMENIGEATVVMEAGSAGSLSMNGWRKMATR